jgi:hypothetical protein
MWGGRCSFSSVLSDYLRWFSPVCHILTLVLLLCLCFSMVRVCVGWVVYVSFSMICYFCVWPGMVLNHRQLSIVVPDWETYLGSLFSIMFRGWLFSVFCCVSAPARTVFGRSLVVSFVISVFRNKYGHISRCTLVLLVSFIRQPLHCDSLHRTKGQDVVF